VRIAFQGEPGAYSERAAVEYLPSAETRGFEAFESVFEALERGDVDRAILPIENSLAGSIHRNYDLLLRHALPIVGEVSLRIRHHLLALPGVRLGEVRRVISHPQALAQCEHHLRDLGIPAEAAYDTAGAARRVRDEGLRDTAAIASRRAAEVYGLEVLAEDVEDDPHNFTRFIILARDAEPLRAGVAARTSLVFSLRDGPGMLFKALSVFALRELDLTKIESRPLRGAGGLRLPPESEQRWRYLFYLDVAAAHGDAALQNALRHLEEIAPFVRLLGSYPRTA